MFSDKVHRMIRLTVLVTSYAALLYLSVSNYNMLTLIESKVNYESPFSYEYVNMILVIGVLTPFYYHSVIHILFEKKNT